MTEEIITISKTEYDELRESMLKLCILAKELFDSTHLNYCGRLALYDGCVTDLMRLLFPVNYAERVAELKAEQEGED